ncbi:MAG: hypothetical protein ACI8PQ_000835 [Planctomycetota bacterium]|jgi:hypothetical protein
MKQPAPGRLLHFLLVPTGASRLLAVLVPAGKHFEVGLRVIGQHLFGRFLHPLLLRGACDPKISIMYRATVWLAFVLLILLSVPSCITASLWKPPGTRIELVPIPANDDDIASDIEVLVFPDESAISAPPPGSPWGTTWRVFATPFTVVADIVTLPVQAILVDPVGFIFGALLDDEAEFDPDFDC